MQYKNTIDDIDTFDILFTDKRYQLHITLLSIKTMNKYYIYIGSNNQSHELEKDKAIVIISEYFEGFTAYEVVGFWKGVEEKTLKVEIVSDEEPVKITRLCKELKKELQQEAILLENIKSNIAFIQ